MGALTMAVESNWRHSMKQRIVKSALMALLVSGAIAGARRRLMGRAAAAPHYNYDSRPVVSEERVIVPASTVTYNAPPVAYRESTVTPRFRRHLSNVSRAGRHPLRADGCFRSPGSAVAVHGQRECRRPPQVDRPAGQSSSRIGGTRGSARCLPSPSRSQGACSTKRCRCLHALA